MALLRLISFENKKVFILLFIQGEPPWLQGEPPWLQGGPPWL
jgi:hypothetical protein